MKEVDYLLAQAITQLRAAGMLLREAQQNLAITYPDEFGERPCAEIIHTLNKTTERCYMMLQLESDEQETKE